MNKLLWMLDTTNSTQPDSDPSDLESATSQLMGEVWPIVSTVLWILTVLLAVVFIVKAITTAMAVMKAADEPQVRQEKLNGFKYLAIGLGVAIVILTLANVIMDVIVDNAISQEDIEKTKTTFLF